MFGLKNGVTPPYKHMHSLNMMNIQLKFMDALMMGHSMNYRSTPKNKQPIKFLIDTSFNNEPSVLQNVIRKLWAHQQ